MAGVPREEGIRCRLASAFPFSLIFGGLEHQCVQTVNALRNLGVSAELLDWCKRTDEFDILHVFGAWHGYYEMCIEASKRCPILVSALAGGMRVNRLRTFGAKLFSLEARLLGQRTLHDRTSAILNGSSRVICSNELEKSFFCERFGLRTEKVAIIPNGVASTRFGAMPDVFRDRYEVENYVLYVGNIVPRKNPVQLAKTLIKEELHGVFIATPVYSEKEYLGKFAKIVESAPNLLWIKGLDYDDPVLDSAYAGASVFCLPSAIETQPVAALEAMAAGVPVVLGDFPYAYQSPFEQTYKCDPNDLSALAECLKNAIGDPRRNREELLESYRWSHVGQRLLNLYRDVIG